jgi:hypothetical protein
MVNLFTEIMSHQRSLKCGGAIKVIASIEDPVIIKKILSNLNEKKSVLLNLLLEDWAAQQDLFDG